MLEIDCLALMNNKKLIHDLIFALTLSGEVIGTFIGAVLIGLYLDHILTTRPIMTLIWLILAFIRIIQILLRIGKK